MSQSFAGLLNLYIIHTCRYMVMPFQSSAHACSNLPFRNIDYIELYINCCLHGGRWRSCSQALPAQPIKDHVPLHKAQWASCKGCCACYRLPTSARDVRPRCPPYSVAVAYYVWYPAEPLLPTCLPIKVEPTSWWHLLRSCLTSPKFFSQS